LKGEKDEKIIYSIQSHRFNLGGNFDRNLDFGSNPEIWIARIQSHNSYWNWGSRNRSDCGINLQKKESQDA